MGNGRFSDGFLIGAVIGGAAVYLLTTPKGNKILKAFTEQGQDAFSDFIKDLEEREVVPHAVKKTEDIARNFTESVVHSASSGQEEKAEETPKTNGHTKKRFFRKAK